MLQILLSIYKSCNNVHSFVEKQLKEHSWANLRLSYGQKLCHNSNTVIFASSSVREPTVCVRVGTKNTLSRLVLVNVFFFHTAVFILSCHKMPVLPDIVCCFLQSGMWFWWCSVYRSPQKRHPVYSETQEAVEIPAEKVSSCSSLLCLCHERVHIC